MKKFAILGEGDQLVAYDEQGKEIASGGVLPSGSLNYAKAALLEAQFAQQIEAAGYTIAEPGSPQYEKIVSLVLDALEEYFSQSCQLELLKYDL